MTTSNPRSSSALVWCSRWNSFGEGPYTIVAKMLNANNLKSGYLKDAIRHRSGIGASLLDPRLNESGTDSAMAFARMLREASLAARIPHLYKDLADDQELRYCAKCMSSGFQAAIAQIPGIERCPIHGDAHRSTCIQCGHKTPPYFLEEGQLPGFSCRACGAPFGGGVPIDRKLDAWVSPSHLDRLAPIHRWLQRMDDSKVIQWMNVSKWSLTRETSEGADTHKRRAVFNVLSSQVAEGTVPKCSLEKNSCLFGPYRVDLDTPSQDLTPAEYEGVLGRLTTPSELRQYRSHFLTPSFGVSVPTDPIVPPELHAHLIWRAQFEAVFSTYTQWYSRSEFCRNVIPRVLNAVGNPLELSLSNSAVIDGVLGAAWLSALQIAKEWNQTLISFGKQESTRANLPWLVAVDRWANRLGCWRGRNFFPVGLIRVKDAATEEHQIYFVVV